MIEPLDYEAVGFMSGLEVHQQLLTTHKLFCRCPGGLYTEVHDGEVLRHMRPTLSELGEYDGTALMEFKTKKEIIYLLNHLNVCTYEMDDTPPFLVNQEAIDVAIELCLMMHMDVIDEVHIARKQYLDGSIPTGFQRTAIVGMNGWLPFQGRRLTVTHVSVEEDSCREVSDRAHRIVWRTDRLGMPLTETVTGPELRTPEEVRDAILLCGLTARSTRRVRTGIGASRQDVNVSVRGGSRVEIKGVPKAGLAVKLVHTEAVRQVNLLKLRDELHRRGLTAPDSIRVDACDVSDIWAGIDSSASSAARSTPEARCTPSASPASLAWPNIPRSPTPRSLTSSRAASASSPASTTRRRCSRGRSSRSSRAGTWCSIASASAPASARTTMCSSCSALRTTCGPPRMKSGCASPTRPPACPRKPGRPWSAATPRSNAFCPGQTGCTPTPTRRPRASPSRRVAALKAGLKPAPWARFERYGAWGVPEETSRYLIRRGGADILDAVVAKTGADGLTAAIMIGQRAKALARAGIPIQRLGPGEWVDVFDLYTGGRIPREAVPVVATRMAKDGLRAADAAAAEGIALVGRETWQRDLEGLGMEGYLAGKTDGRDKRLRFLAGRAMARLKGRAPAKDVAAYLAGTLEEIVR